MRVLATGEWLRGAPAILPLVNVTEPEREPVPFQLALAVLVMLPAEISPPSRLGFKTVAWLVALAPDEVICPEALLLIAPALPGWSELNPLTLFCDEPPAQLMPEDDSGPIELEPDPARPLA